MERYSQTVISMVHFILFTCTMIQWEIYLQFLSNEEPFLLSYNSWSNRGQFCHMRGFHILHGLLMIILWKYCWRIGWPYCLFTCQQLYFSKVLRVILKMVILEEQMQFVSRFCWYFLFLRIFSIYQGCQIQLGFQSLQAY